MLRFAADMSSTLGIDLGTDDFIVAAALADGVRVLVAEAATFTKQGKARAQARALWEADPDRDALLQAWCVPMLKEAKARSESLLGEVITDAVLAVPAYLYWRSNALSSIRAAAATAGLRFAWLVAVPIAATVAVLDQIRGDATAANVLVYKLAERDFDATVLRISEDAFAEVLVEVDDAAQARGAGLWLWRRTASESLMPNAVGDDVVLCLDGDKDLGARTFEDAVVAHLLARIEERRCDRLDDARRERYISELHGALGRATETLMAAREAGTPCSELSVSTTLAWAETLTCGELWKITRGLVEHSLSVVDRCLKRAQLTRDRVEHVVTVGRYAQVPWIALALQDHLCARFVQEVTPKDRAALGAAVIGLWKKISRQSPGAPA